MNESEYPALYAVAMSNEINKLFTIKLYFANAFCLEGVGKCLTRFSGSPLNKNFGALQNRKLDVGFS